MRNYMSTKGYTIKYSLNKNNKFSHSEFAKDFISEFRTRVFNNNALEDYTRFEKTIVEARSKYDAINNKTAGEIGEGLWEYMFGAFISKLRLYLFPSYKKGARLNIPPSDKLNEEFSQEVDNLLLTNGN